MSTTNQYDPAKLLSYIDRVIQREAAKYTQRPGVIREAIFAFIILVCRHIELPGAILLSRYGGFFKDPASANGNGKKSTFRACLNSILSKLSKPCEEDDLPLSLIGLVGPIFNYKGKKSSMTKIAATSNVQRGRRSF